MYSIPIQQPKIHTKLRPSEWVRTFQKHKWIQRKGATSMLKGPPSL